MSVDHARPIYVAILGTDAFLAAGPVDPVQLSRACQSAGFDLVVPVSWGEEIIATYVGERLASQRATTVVVSACPLVNRQVLATPTGPPVLQTVSPPIATARYLRAALDPREVHITYVGACPGAASPEIDVHCLPDILFTRLVEAGIDITRQPRHLDGQLPADRARYASSPGGLPETNWLMARAEMRLVQAAPVTAEVVAQLHRDEALVIDLAAACRCVCARDRIAAMRLEPPRSTKPVVGNVPVVVVVEPESVPDQQVPQPPVEEAPAAEHRRARFAENGLSAGEADLIPPPAHILSRAFEPW
ncbi:MAG TPA: [Fe-Fe] hydrogenase large subunit C-terminal domain-containing protein [Gemmatimonadaceae bacterium]